MIAKLRNFRWSLVLAGLGLLFGVFVSTTYAQEPPWSVQILEADAQHVLLELTLSDFDSELIAYNGAEYQHLTVPDWGTWSQPGQPQLPMHSIPLGMPQLGTPQVEVVETEEEAFSGYLIYPAPKLVRGGTEETLYLVEDFILDTETYNTNKFIPGSLAEAAEIGLMRDQPLFQLKLYPFQYNPQQQLLRVYRRMKVRVTFPGVQFQIQAGEGQTSPVFEQILQNSLLNYKALPRPQVAVSPPSSPPIFPQDSQAQIKLKVEQDGLYQVTYNDLNNVAPTDFMNSDPHNFEFSYQGTAIPVLFYGDGDNSFESGERFLFYGQGIDSEYTRENVYWLKIGSSPGLRMTERNVPLGVGATASSFSDSRHYEENSLYWQDMPDGNGKDHWFWGDRLTVSTGTITDTVDYSFELNNIAGSGVDGQLKVMLHGRTTQTHTTQLYLNNTPLISSPGQDWNDAVEKPLVTPASQSLFVEGTNTLRIENVLPAGTGASEFYVNWFEVTYQDTYVAENNRLNFSAPANNTYTFEITGFLTNSLELIEITDPLSPTRLTNHTVDKPNTTYRLRFTDSSNPTRQYLAQTTDSLPSPTIQLDEAFNWKSSANGATYVIITHSKFFTEAQTLATYRTGKGETAVVVKTDDIYDEFNGGIYDPQAIRDFLEYAYYNWSPPPLYAVLVGDASLDPKNNRGSSLPDFVPVHYQDTALLGQTPIDNWYTNLTPQNDSEKDIYPDIILGRIPTRSSSEVTTVVNKIQNYELASPSAAWAHRAVLVADDDDDRLGRAFYTDTLMINDLLPSSVISTHIIVNNPGVDIPAAVGSGALLLAYSGHGSGSYAWWADDGVGNFFSKGDIPPNMSNDSGLPFVTVGNCRNGYFVEYNRTRSMAEEFLLVNNKGSIAAWAPSSYGFATIDTLMLDKLYTALMKGGNPSLGATATTARHNSLLVYPIDPAKSLVEAFTFFGDPAIRLNLPPSLSIANSVESTNNLVQPGDAITYTITIANTGGDANNVTVTDTLPSELVGSNLNETITVTASETVTFIINALVVNDVPSNTTVINTAYFSHTSGTDQADAIFTTAGDTANVNVFLPIILHNN